MAKFQVELAGEWKDYKKDEDKILKRAFLSGFPNCKFTLRGATYEYNFRRMVQKNLTSGKERKIRAPYRWRQPAKPIVPRGPTMCMKVPAGSPGTTIKLDHPYLPGVKMNVAVPAAAKVGKAMLVPVPDIAIASVTEVSVTGGVFADAAVASGLPIKGKGKGKGKGRGRGRAAPGGAEAAPTASATCTPEDQLEPAEPSASTLAGAQPDTTKLKDVKEETKAAAAAGEWSTGSKVAVGAALVAAAAGGVIAADIATEGATGEMLEDGVEDAADWVGEAGEDAVEWTEGAAEDVAEWADDAGIVDAAEDAGEWIVEAAEDAAEWIDEAADDVGDFIMDLF
eukprot:CAMPEP_0178398606 /NCGR_PEP_ID=MMETSP0689_2-20121128/14859_1 /TAXON_ID=160604 /ORGANISM="Amphidinium massartii, Strain CS-259" /LENGTH=338 /DNA_ID=CAMNT_0020019373 /DNA_START=84 /DNA_END=1100 /DNA_ORIENTATION=-